MADRHVAGEAGELAFVEDLGHQPEILVHRDGIAVTSGDTGAFLTPMLEGK